MKYNCATPQLAVLIAAALALPAQATIYGTMSNFDVYNETETEAHGAEIELEGIHREDLSRDFPSHFNSKTISEYTNGANFGTRITYNDYNFNCARLFGADSRPIDQWPRLRQHVRLRTLRISPRSAFNRPQPTTIGSM